MTARNSAQNPSRLAAAEPDADQPAADQPGATPASGQPAARRPAAERPAFEQARDELTALVKRLEAGGLTLEQSLELWERGERLATICEEWLEGARARLAGAMAQPADGGPAAPF